MKTLTHSQSSWFLWQCGESCSSSVHSASKKMCKNTDLELQCTMGIINPCAVHGKTTDSRYTVCVIIYSGRICTKACTWYKWSRKIVYIVLKRKKGSSPHNQNNCWHLAKDKPCVMIQGSISEVIYIYIKNSACFSPYSPLAAQGLLYLRWSCYRPRPLMCWQRCHHPGVSSPHQQSFCQKGQDVRVSWE